MTFFLWSVAISRNLLVFDLVDRTDLASIARAAGEWTRAKVLYNKIAEFRSFRYFGPPYN
uniref:Uncharacterized protein n=1 Tax=Romanomermis culicivorax TaxID=13658 RepID=A0A915J6F4_ROMCU